MISTQDPPLVKLGNIASKTSNCISLGQGAPYYQPPKQILENIIHNIEDPLYHRYTPDPGLYELRKLVADKYQQEYGVYTDYNQIMITPGANQAFINCLISIVDEGDSIILISPYYFNHEMAANLLNIHTINIPLSKEFMLPLDQIAFHLPKVKAIVIVNPGNPSGNVISRQELQHLEELLIDTNVWLISDETYEYFTYNNIKHFSASSLQRIKDQVIIISSFSKTFGIPGWRVGYYHAPNDFITISTKVQDTTGICAPAISQILVIELLRSHKYLISDFVNIMKKNHELAVDLLAEIHWLEATPSNAAYYLFPHQLTSMDTEKLAMKLITDYGVYIVPGIGFGRDWSNYLRISFANVDEETIQEAFSRLKSLKY
ncbi:MAG: pyridoxal phosphate-dependent aminotransferase [Candidatus Heimdallarchaeota archaeon]|nr:pyridoxal phosphate-dependent aminotransferase [Candidatus Heimdallarchaeota archaeon]